MKMSSGRALALAVLPVLLAGAGAGTASARPASGNPPPPKGFEADSASFVSAQAGFVLGARHCSEMPCTARLEKTVNGGQSWTRVPAPPVSLVPPYTGSPRSAVSTVRFENARDGWLFNPGLWVTTDGGRQWHRAAVPGVVTALAASDGVVFAAAKPARAGLDTARLYRSQVGSTSWSLVPGVSPAGALTVSGHSAWAGIAPELWTTTDSGQHWSALPFHCPPAAVSASPVAAASASDVALACSDQGFPQPGFSRKLVFTSADGGHTFQMAGRPAEAGQVRMLAMPPLNPQVITLTAASGASFLYRSVDDGHTWNRRTFFDGGLEVRDLAYTSASTGYLIHFSGGPVIAYGLGLMKTVNAGAGWTSVAIP